MSNVKITTVYITLGQMLKHLSIIGSGGEAKMFLTMNDVYVNGVLENRRGKKLYPGDKLKIDDLEYNIIADED